MKMIISTILATVAFMPLLAQSMNGDYKNVGVYDTWEQSPFRTGVLTGNVQVIENHLYDANGVNRTGHILGIQRSRFGSNTFGARVDLNSVVTIGRDGKYVHALVYSPIATQVQFVGLGKRTTNTWNEKEDVEQFWSEPVSISANRWTDIVSLVKTNENVEIYSIVVVPDCSSPHALTEDFVAYIDEIEVNNSSSSRTAVTSTVDPYDGTEPGGDVPVDPDESLYYKTSFNKKTTENKKLVDSSSSMNYAVSVSLTDADGHQQQYPSGSPSEDLLSKKAYLDATGIAVFDVTAGQEYTPYVDYKSDWMHAYAYIDYDRNGEFTYQLDGNQVAEGSELVAFSAYSPDYTGGTTGTWYDSKGNRLGDINAGNTITMPSFTIPSDLQSGRYRMRFKIDWYSLDAAGNNATDNAIWNNGGAIVDVILNVTGSNDVSVKLANSRNGNIQDSNGNAITSGGVTGTYNSPFQVVMKPASGFASNSLTAAYMTDDSDCPGLLKEATATYSVSGDNYNPTSDAFTLPAEIMYSSVTLEPLFTEAPTPAKTIYQLTDELVEGGEYLIVNVNSAGDGFALSHNGTTIASDGVTIHGKDENPSIPAENVYVQDDDVVAASVWTATMSDNSMKLVNNNYYFQSVYYTRYTLVFVPVDVPSPGVAANGSWTYDNKGLSYTYIPSSGLPKTSWVIYDNNKFTAANNENEGKVYLYKKVEVEAPSAKTFDLTIGDAGWATLYLDFAVDIPDGLTEVFYISSIEDGVAKGKTVADAIPAETGVLIKGGKGTYHLTESSSAAAKPTDNLLTGTLEGIADASTDAMTSSAYGMSLYTLGRTNSGKVQLALFTGKKIEKNKAFMIWEGNGTVGEAKAFSIVMDNGTTAITAVNDGETGNDDWYSLQGVRLSGRPTQKGVYIHQGKRIFVK